MTKEESKTLIVCRYLYPAFAISVFALCAGFPTVSYTYAGASYPKTFSVYSWIREFWQFSLTESSSNPELVRGMQIAIVVSCVLAFLALAVTLWAACFSVPALCFSQKDPRRGVCRAYFRTLILFPAADAVALALLLPMSLLPYTFVGVSAAYGETASVVYTGLPPVAAAAVLLSGGIALALGTRKAERESAFSPFAID